MVYKIATEHARTRPGGQRESQIQRAFGKPRTHGRRPWPRPSHPSLHDPSSRAAPASYEIHLGGGAEGERAAGETEASDARASTGC